MASFFGGSNASKLDKLQKKLIRIIVNACYNSHTDPIFRDVYTLHVLRFLYLHKKTTFCLPILVSCVGVTQTTMILKQDFSIIFNYLPTAIKKKDFAST